MPRLNQYSAILIAVSVLIGYMIMYQYTDITTSKFIADWVAMIGLSFMSFSTLPVAGLLATSIANAAGFGASAPMSGEVPLHRKEIIIFAIAAGFSGVIAGIAVGVYLVAGWVV